MKRDISNKKDVDNSLSVDERGKKGYIKFKKGKNFIRLISTEYEEAITHGFKVGGKFVSFICIQKKEGDMSTYNPDTCPACSVAKEKFWDPRKKIKENPKYENSDTLQAKAENLNKKGKLLLTKHERKFLAIYGEAEKVKDRRTGKITYEPEWEKEAKILSVSSAQYKKLTRGIFEKYDYIKTSKDLLNRNLMFNKEAEKGEEITQATPIKIVPCKEISPAPKYENELPNLDKEFTVKSVKEIKEIMDKFLNSDVEFEEDDVEVEKDDEFEDDEFSDDVEANEDYDVVDDEDDEMEEDEVDSNDEDNDEDEFEDDENEDSEDDEFEQEAEKSSKKFHKEVSKKRQTNNKTSSKTKKSIKKVLNKGKKR